MFQLMNFFIYFCIVPYYPPLYRLFLAIFALWVIAEGERVVIAFFGNVKSCQIGGFNLIF